MICETGHERVDFEYVFDETRVRVHCFELRRAHNGRGWNTVARRAADGALRAPLLLGEESAPLDACRTLTCVKRLFGEECDAYVAHGGGRVWQLVVEGASADERRRLFEAIQARGWGARYSVHWSVRWAGEVKRDTLSAWLCE